ncbi:flagellar biosynthetic protein FlhB [Desulfocapsa sulfexigens DSM 10523]|uniref:Flagellar biosynthetic protein FlhB n=1 Tax=Desulfocapsa sulfexigens (strain DSM 10523 / SB164P1) TaxID=1167006 RepID=M1PJ69_DESSD|nr:flagellar biosynthesis protein FlhB [Desulfocapsa sulfexigens]AGF79620.1 flagellar biosynthetic protein FlhB [Desulfocapsa sulfexigens DSM 10523]
MAEESSSGGEKTEAPSSKRRTDFRKKGQVAQSKEVQTAALFTLVLLFWIFYMPSFWSSMSELLATLWRNLSVFDGSSSGITSLAIFLVKNMAVLLAPLFVLVMIIGVFSSLFQIGWLFTTQPLAPDFSKLDPIKGFGRMFSMKSLVDLVKSILKIILIAWVAYSTVLNNFEEALILVDTSVTEAILYLGRTATLILAKVCAILILIAAIDFLYTRYEMEEKMKMTKQEVKEEYKEMEGDPYIKSQIRRIQQEMARKRMMAEVPDADVVVTNPTHFAVAIKYDSLSMDSPVVIAKGADHVAMRIREIARENNVPLIENPPVARLLHNIDLGAAIPEELFKAVAEILAHVYSLKK